MKTDQRLHSKRLLRLSIISALLISGCSIWDPVPEVKIVNAWEKTIGGSRNESDIQVIQAPDDNYVVLGWTNSEDGLQNPTHGDQDVCIQKYTSIGDLIWQYSYGGSGYDDGFSITDIGNGFVAVGGTSSRDGDLSPEMWSTQEGQQDIWVFRTDIYGKIQHQRLMGGSALDYARSIHNTSDGGYVIAGASMSNNGDLSMNFGELDMWIVKLTQNLEIQWQKTYGGSKYDDPYCVRQLSGGGYIVAGVTGSSDHNVDDSNGALDGWVLKLNSSGEIVWKKSFGGSYNESFFNLLLLDGGDILLVGFNDSEDADENPGSSTEGWVVRLNSSGELQWEKTYGGSGVDIFRQVVNTEDGGFLIAGSTTSNDGDIVEVPNGKTDAWLVKLSGTGELKWEKTLGGSDNDYGESIIQTEDGQFVLGCSVNSNDGDIVGNHGNSDLWVKKFNISEIVE